MSTLEATVCLLEQLSESELFAIQGVAREFISRNNESYLFKSQTEEELIKRIDTSIKAAQDGHITDANVLEKELREEFGI